MVDRKRYLKPASVDSQCQHSSILCVSLSPCLFVSVFELTRVDTYMYTEITYGCMYFVVTSLMCVSNLFIECLVVKEGG